MPATRVYAQMATDCIFKFRFLSRSHVISRYLVLKTQTHTHTHAHAHAHAHTIRVIFPEPHRVLGQLAPIFHFSTSVHKIYPSAHKKIRNDDQPIFTHTFEPQQIMVFCLERSFSSSDWNNGYPLPKSCAPEKVDVWKGHQPSISFQSRPALVTPPFPPDLSIFSSPMCASLRIEST